MQPGIAHQLVSDLAERTTPSEGTTGLHQVFDDVQHLDGVKLRELYRGPRNGGEQVSTDLAGLPGIINVLGQTQARNTIHDDMGVIFLNGNNP
ncbi:hypothetical protein D9M69_353950 [compost metagenome]